ncbi:multidrug effflux MFS transporter [Chryseolinea sp. H1M3-3]|uniref:multidrug effflux MFS transporter n=1 Tax=Chryseolinea sp. H1M3-3 TaxID=3034144 RepID=UPI0023EE046E|nr:multidrug effflux MFS transporter [Chryseolinea sp. H1M3-3]
MLANESNRTLIILILGALSTVTPFSIDMYLPAFSEIAEDFGTTPARISLSVTSYFIGMAIGQMMYGPLLDRFGRKKPLYVGLTIFIITCIGCTQAQSIEALVALRFLQALGGCVAWVAALTMARDFFPVRESAKIFSLLILVIGLSPLLAPTIGGFIATAWGWQAVFIVLAIIVFLILIVSAFFLPPAQSADENVSLKAKPMLLTFLSILRNPQFYTYSFSGAFAFASLFIYVAGSPVIFMEIFQVTPQVYGGIFALLSIGFIGGSQLNIYINKKYSSERIFSAALYTLVLTSLLFLIGALNNWYGLEATIVMFFIALTCLGLTNPNATALALAPFSKNVGSASALLGFIQIGVAGLSSAGVGLFNSTSSLPVAAIMAFTSLVSFFILIIGRKRILMEVPVQQASAETIIH